MKNTLLRKIKGLHFRFQKGVSKELKTIAIASVGHTVLKMPQNTHVRTYIHSMKETRVIKPDLLHDDAETH